MPARYLRPACFLHTQQRFPIYLYETSSPIPQQRTSTSEFIFILIHIVKFSEFRVPKAEFRVPNSENYFLPETQLHLPPTQNPMAQILPKPKSHAQLHLPPTQKPMAQILPMYD